MSYTDSIENDDFTFLFLKKKEVKVRKCVYISKEVHDIISGFVRTVSGGDVTVGGYIDSVLLQHLETYGHVINDLYAKERKDLITF